MQLVYSINEYKNILFCKENTCKYKYNDIISNIYNINIKKYVLRVQENEL